MLSEPVACQKGLLRPSAWQSRRCHFLQAQNSICSNTRKSQPTHGSVSLAGLGLFRISTQTLTLTHPNLNPGCPAYRLKLPSMMPDGPCVQWAGRAKTHQPEGRAQRDEAVAQPRASVLVIALHRQDGRHARSPLPLGERPEVNLQANGILLPPHTQATIRRQIFLTPRPDCCRFLITEMWQQ